MNIAVLDDIHNAFDADSAIQRLRQAGHHVVVFTQALTPANRAASLKGVDVVIPIRERSRLDDAFYHDAPDLKLISQTGRAGPHIDRAATNKRGILICEGASTRYSPSTAELAIALMLAIMRRVPQSFEALKAGRWETPMGITLAGKTLGLVGFGRIGGQMARLGNAFDMKVLAYSKNMTSERAATAGATAVDLPTLMRESDVVSVHLALNDGTRGLITGELLRLMKPAAYFVNTARADVTDEAALITVLQDRRIAGAGLDVFTQEPLPANPPLLALDNVVLTPHAGYPPDVSYEAFAEGAVSNIEAWLAGKPQNVANPQVLEGKQ